MKRIVFPLGLLMAAAPSWALLPVVIYITNGGNGRTGNEAVASAKAKALADCKSTYGGVGSVSSSYVYTNGDPAHPVGAIATIACIYTPTDSGDIGAMVGSIRSLDEKCLDATNYGVDLGTPIQTYRCLYGDNQLWTIKPNSGLIYGLESGLALDVKGYGTANGSELQLYEEAGTENQKWEFRNAAILGVEGKALDVVDGYSDNGTKLQLFTYNGTAAQTWNYNPATGQIKGISGKCLDIAGGAVGAGLLAQIYDCNGSAAQKFSIGGQGTIRYNGYCLGTSGGVSNDRTKISTFQCSGDASQSWRLVGEIRSIASNRCLTQTSSADGARPVIYDCDSSQDQKWIYSSY